MPTEFRREHTLIEHFLSSYEHNSWAHCHCDWLEKKEDGAVEVLATRSDGKTLAIEHTLIQPFVGDKKDFAYFRSSFLRIEEDKSLIVPERIIYVDIPIGSLQKGYSWNPVVTAVHEWLKANRLSLPEGQSQHTCPIGAIRNRKASDLNLQVRVVFSPGFAGAFMIRRYGEERLGEVVEGALRKKLPKLVKTDADKHILLFERDQFTLSELSIYDKIEERRAMFSDLAKVHEVWFAETVFYETDKYVRFELYDSGVLVQTLGFLDGRLIERSENGMPSSDVHTLP
jgi:hypothetical protein